MSFSATTKCAHCRTRLFLQIMAYEMLGENNSREELWLERKRMYFQSAISLEVTLAGRQAAVELNLIEFKTLSMHCRSELST